MIAREVVTGAFAMSGLPAYSKPLTNGWCSLQLLVSVTPGGQRYTPSPPNQESIGCLTSQ